MEANVSWAALSKFDDILCDVLLEPTWLWFEIKKFFPYRKKPRFSTTNSSTTLQRLSKNEITIQEAEKNIKEIELIDKHYRLKGDLSSELFTRHLNMYLSVFLQDAGFEINSTRRYEKVSGIAEASISAIVTCNKYSSIKYLSGLVIPIKDRDIKLLEIESSDFSVIWLDKKKKMFLLLGPARFVNHDCNPNSKFILSSNNTINFQALRDISLGEEITTSYGKNYFGIDNCECMCQTCENNTRGYYCKEKTILSGTNQKYMSTRSKLKNSTISKIETSNNVLCMTCNCIINDVTVMHAKVAEKKKKVLSSKKEDFNIEKSFMQTVIFDEDSVGQNLHNSNTSSKENIPINSTKKKKTEDLKQHSYNFINLNSLITKKSIYGNSEPFSSDPDELFDRRDRGSIVLIKQKNENSASDTYQNYDIGMFIKEKDGIADVILFGDGELLKLPTKDLLNFVPNEKHFFQKKNKLQRKKKKDETFEQNINTSSNSTLGEDIYFDLNEFKVRLMIAYYEYRFLAPLERLCLLIFIKKRHLYKPNDKVLNQITEFYPDLDYSKKKLSDTKLFKIRGINEAFYHALTRTANQNTELKFDFNLPVFEYMAMFYSLDTVKDEFEKKESCGVATAAKNKKIKLTPNAEICDQNSTEKKQGKEESQCSTSSDTDNINKITENDKPTNDKTLTYKYKKSGAKQVLKYFASYFFKVGDKVRVLDKRDMEIHLCRIEYVEFISNDYRLGLYYYVHFLGWSSSFDIWIPPSCIINYR
ncbi:hypothetical protein BB561_001354 [Smittium simulii]|uniref:SET domain-containing protein n=1 Tax=Smittium simulii TaxID=133385 RepID=A0A2T9YV11_9FUNG|nr:hypothetical protein BB561_001354 [Smittium simulii]